MNRAFIKMAACLFVAFAVINAPAGDIAPAGRHLAEILDSMHVDQLWLPGYHVDWRTGVSNGKPLQTAGGHTHCSAFAAAAAEKTGIYLLRPPEHSAVLLANAQQDWLRGPGTNQGWSCVTSAVVAQHLANEGEFVVITCKNPDPKMAGHIAVVRPSTKSDAEILAEGPQIIQAGRHNYISTNAREGFKNHPGAFENKQLLYFAHPLPLNLEAQ
jgi:hypothetical protein